MLDNLLLGIQEMKENKKKKQKKPQKNKKTETTKLVILTVAAFLFQDNWQGTENNPPKITEESQR